MPPPADAGPGSSFITGRAMQSAGLIDGSVGSICAAGAAHEHSQVLTRIGLSALIQGIPGFMYSRVQNTGTPAVTGSPACACSPFSHSAVHVHTQIDRYRDPDHLLRNPPCSGRSLVGSRCCTYATPCYPAAIIWVIIQPDRSSPAPGPVDLSIKREVLLPAANRDRAPIVLRHGGIVEANRRAFLSARTGEFITR